MIATKNVAAFVRSGGAPLFFLALVFAGNTHTILKSAALGAGILLFSRQLLRRFFDSNLVVLTAFILVYFAVSSLDSYWKTAPPYPLLVMPPLLYAGGKWLGHRSSSGTQVCFSYLLIGALLASVAAYAVFINVALTGFVGGSRDITLTANGDEGMSATVLGGTMVILSSYVGLIFNSAKGFGVVKKIVIAILFGVSMFAALRLGSRTLPAIALACAIIGTLLNVRRASLYRVALLAGFIGLVVYVALDHLPDQIDIFSYYRDRADSDEFGVSTAGGRLERWSNALRLIPKSPLGWRLSENGYSHNLWLDVARNGGWAPLLLSIITSILFIASLKSSLRRNREDQTFATTAICVALGFFLLFSVEPILDGFMYVFGAFCCYWGIIAGFTSRDSRTLGSSRARRLFGSFPPRSQRRVLLDLDS